MKMTKIWLASALTAISFSSLNAQSPIASPPPNSANQNLHKLDSTTSGPGIRVSKLIGTKIQNSANESVGQIKDIVVNPASLRVQYVAVTYGGFLGLGDKLFAVPMQAIQVKQDPDNHDRVVLILDVTKEQMAGAQGFDEANWPDFANTTIAGEIYRRYKLEDLWIRSNNQGGRMDVNVDKSGVNINVDGRKK